MMRRALLSEFLSDSDYQFNLIDDAIIKVVSRISGIRYNTLFRKGGTDKFRKAKRLYCDIMINHLDFNQTIIAKAHFRGVDSLVLNNLKSVKINYNDEYNDRRKTAIEVINILKKHSPKN
jgi:hypothetical protein